MKEAIIVTRALFSTWVVLLYVLFYTGVVTIYMNQLTRNLGLSVIIGFIGALMLFYAFNVVARQISDKKKQLDDINTYVAMVVTSLKSGKNVPDSMLIAREKVSEHLRGDIDVAINSMQESGDLDLSEFERHNFVALNVFHKNLTLYYMYGGDAKEIFRTTTKTISRELNHRDDLSRDKSATNQITLIAYLIVLGTPLTLSFVGELWKIFASVPIANYSLNSLVTLAVAFSCLRARRQQRDVSVTQGS